jgi:Tfp pilus assembly protein FimV
MKTINTAVFPHPYWFWPCAATVLLLGAIALPARAAGAQASQAVPANSESAQAVRSYRPKAGESLDHVIKQTMPESPLRMELLRKAFVDLNSHAFVGGNASKMRSKVTLQVPDAQRLARAVLGSVIEARVSDPAADDATNRSGPTSGATQEGRRWVRYP